MTESKGDTSDTLQRDLQYQLRKSNLFYWVTNILTVLIKAVYGGSGIHDRAVTIKQSLSVPLLLDWTMIVILTYKCKIFPSSPVQSLVPVGCPSFLPPSSVTSCQSADWHCGAGNAGSRPDWGLFGWEPAGQTWGWNVSCCLRSLCLSEPEK